jgi:protein TonB
LIDAVDRLIIEREAMDRGLPGSVLLSIAAHLFLVGVSFAAPFLFKGEPLLRVQDGFAVQLPPGGGGVPIEQAAPAAPKAEPQPPVTAPPAPKPEAKPAKILKPPKDEPKRGLPELDAKRGRKPDKPVAASSALGGRGTSTQTPGLEFGPAGPGVPGGSDPFGDWYLASVKQKIWLIWTQQVKSAMSQPAIVSFTIHADGSLTDVRLVQSSGATLMDFAAQRAIDSASPFGPLPKNYATDRITIQGVFEPAS